MIKTQRLGGNDIIPHLLPNANCDNDGKGGDILLHVYLHPFFGDEAKVVDLYNRNFL